MKPQGLNSGSETIEGGLLSQEERHQVDRNDTDRTILGDV